MRNGRKTAAEWGMKSRWEKILNGFVIACLVLGAAAAGAYLGMHSQSGNKSAVQKAVDTVQQAAAHMEESAGPPVLLTGGTAAIPIIMYHDVVPAKDVYFDMTNREFARQMASLTEADAHPVSIQDAYDHLQANKALPERPILLTFDDCTLGQLTNALPILQKHHFPAVFFVQTGFVGVTTGKQHMTWDQLKQAESTGLVTVESHTVTHPEDITKLSDTDIARELQDSKAAIEVHLGHKVNFLAYPSGNCDSRLGEAAQRAGYLAAVTMDRGWAASPAQSYFLPRFAPQRVVDVIAGWDGSGPIEPPLPRLLKTDDEALTMGTFTEGATPVQWVAGGDLATQAINTRKTVGEMALAAGAQAALNGTFFADARVQSEESAMIGPVLSSVGQVYKPDTPSEEDRIQGRPLILVGDHRCLITPFYPHLGHSQDDLRCILPDVKDAFLAGGWIVHDGKAQTAEWIRSWSTHDAGDPRHRAFVGIDKDGRYILGATQDSVSTSQLAPVLEKMGVQEAFLLDSGFSTSLIWQNHVLVSGHSRKDVPSRPVPHALFLLGEVAPGALPPPADSPVAAGDGAASTEDALAADSTKGASHYASHHHHPHRHPKRKSPDAGPLDVPPAASTPVVGAGDDSPT